MTVNPLATDQKLITIVGNGGSNLMLPQTKKALITRNTVSTQVGIGTIRSSPTTPTCG